MLCRVLKNPSQACVLAACPAQHTWGLAFVLIVWHQAGGNCPLKFCVQPLASPQACSHVYLLQGTATEVPCDLPRCLATRAAGPPALPRPHAGDSHRTHAWGNSRWRPDGNVWYIPCWRRRGAPATGLTPDGLWAAVRRCQRPHAGAVAVPPTAGWATFLLHLTAECRRISLFPSWS